MSDETELYRVLYYTDGRETLSEPMPHDDAERHARELDSLGLAVGSVMDVANAKAYMEDRYGTHYRGVKIPDDLRADGMSRRVYEAWKQGVDSRLDEDKPKPADEDPFAPDFTMSRDVADFILRAVNGLLLEGYWPKAYTVDGRHGGGDTVDYDDALLLKAADVVGRDRIKNADLLRLIAEADADAKGGAS